MNTQTAVLLLLMSLSSISGENVDASLPALTKIKEFRATKVGIRFEQGNSCRNRREDAEYCESWASGASTVDSNGVTAIYSFNTTDNVNINSILVEGLVTALFMENITDTKCSVSGMLQAVSPSWVVEPFEGLSDRPIRLYQRRDRDGNTLTYEWLEITVSGVYDPLWVDSRELRQKYDSAKKAQQDDNKEEL